MHVEIIFCDIDKKFIKACEDACKNNRYVGDKFIISTYIGDITKYKRLKKLKNVAYVSPANCFGSMGCGNKTKMFPDIDKVVMNKIGTTKYVWTFNTWFLIRVI